MSSRLSLLTVLCSIILSPVSSLAVTQRFSAFDLRPAVGDRYYFSMSSSEGLRRFQYDFQLSNLLIYRSLDILDPTTGARVNSVVDYALGHFLNAGFGITDTIQAGLTLPVFSIAKFADPTVAPVTSQTVTRLGDLRLTAKFRLLDADHNRFGVAIEPFFTIPLGADDAYLGDSGVSGGAIAAGDFLITPRIRATMNIGAELKSERVVISNVDFQHRFLSALGVSGKITDDLTISAETHANTAFSSFFGDRATRLLEFVGNVSYDIGDTGFSVGAGAGTCALCGVKGAKARGFLTVGYRRRSVEDLAKEKEVQETRVELRETKSETDQFASIVLALKQNCPEDPTRFNPEVHDTACPKFFKIRDQVIALATNNVTLQGTQEELFSEVVLSFKKNCPKNAADFDPERHDAGCPKFYKIQKQAIRVVKRERGTSKEGKGAFVPVHFAFNRTTITKESAALLRQVSEALARVSGKQEIEVTGYADSVGTPKANRKISLLRARKVIEYLKRIGVPKNIQLVPIGRGSVDPVATNTTPEGRLQNRRVLFRLAK